MSDVFGVCCDWHKHGSTCWVMCLVCVVIDTNIGVHDEWCVWCVLWLTQTWEYMMRDMCLVFVVELRCHSWSNPLFPITYIFLTCQACCLELHQINSVHHYLVHDVLKTLTCAFILSQIDYCNSLLAGCPKNLICKLQKVQNNAAPLISHSARSDHISSDPLCSSLASCRIPHSVQNSSYL